MVRSDSLRRFALLFCTLTAASAFAQGVPLLLHDPPMEAFANEPLELDVVLEPSVPVQRFVVRYRGPGAPFRDLPMELAYGDLYRATIPASDVSAPALEYSIDAVLRDGKRVAAYPRRGKPIRLAVIKQGGRHPTQKEMDAAFTAAPKGSSIDDAFGDEDPPEEKPVRGKEPPPKKKQPPVVKRVTEKRALPEAPPETDPADEEEMPRVVSRPRDPPADALASQLEQELASYSADDPFTRASRQDATARRTTEFKTVITREQILARGSRVLHDVLSTVPGLSVSRDVQGFYRTGVRGLREDAEVLFLLNGHRLNSFYDGRALASLPVENVERVEVTQGPGPAYQGLNAFRAVVNVVTRRDPGARGAFSAGSFNTFDGAASGGGDLGPVRFFADADFRTQKGYQKPIAQDVLANETAFQELRSAEDPVGRTDDRRQLINLGAGFAYDGPDVGTVGLALRYLHEARGALVGHFDTVGPGSQLGWDVIAADLRFQRALNERFTLRVGLSTDLQSTSRLFVLSPKGFRVGESVLVDGAQERVKTSALTLGAVGAIDFHVSEDHRLSFGTTVDQQSLTGFSYESNTSAAGEALGGFNRPENLVLPTEAGEGVAARRLAVGLYVDDRWTVVDPLTLSLGLRLDAIQLPTENDAGELSGTTFVPSLNPRIGVAFAMTPAVVLRLGYARSFRAPTVSEYAEPVANSIFSRGRFPGNPRLEPVMTDSLQLGTDWVQSVGSGQLRLNGTLFAEQLSQPITGVDTSLPLTALRNRDGVRIFGAEGEARLEVSRRTSAFLNASFFRAEDLRTPSGLRLLTDTPQALVNGGFSLPMGPWVNLDLLVQAGVERRNNSRETLELLRRYSLPGYALVTAQLRSEKIADHVEVTLSGRNLFDTPLVDDAARPDRMPGGVPREGFNGFLTVRGEL